MDHGRYRYYWKCKYSMLWYYNRCNIAVRKSNASYIEKKLVYHWSVIYYCRFLIIDLKSNKCSACNIWRASSRDWNDTDSWNDLYNDRRFYRIWTVENRTSYSRSNSVSNNVRTKIWTGNWISIDRIHHAGKWI